MYPLFVTIGNVYTVTDGNKEKAVTLCNSFFVIGDTELNPVISGIAERFIPATPSGTTCRPDGAAGCAGGILYYLCKTMVFAFFTMIDCFCKAGQTPLLAGA